MSESTVQELLDREAIRDLPVLYCAAVIRRDVEAVVDLFAPDGEFVVPEDVLTVEDPSTATGPNRVCKGHDALRAMYQEALTPPSPLPVAGNVLVELTGADRARGTCVAHIRQPHNSALLTIASYDDEYVKTGSGWKFSRRSVSRLQQFNRPGGGSSG